MLRFEVLRAALPCPLCGCLPAIIKLADSEAWIIECKNPTHTVSVERDKAEKALEEWNSRTLKL